MLLGSQLPYSDKYHTITFDNGKEFAEHEKMAAELKADIYFANPYHSWERELNESSNGLLRQSFLKGMELTDITEEQAKEAVSGSTTVLEIYSDSEPHMRYSSGWNYATPTIGCCTSNFNPRFELNTNFPT